MDSARVSESGGLDDARGPSPATSRSERRCDAAPQRVEHLLHVSEVHLAADNPVAALECLEQAEVLLSECQAPASQRAEVMLRIAACLRKRGELEKGLRTAAAVLELLAQADDPVLRGRAYACIGDIQGGLGRYAEALAACEQAYELLRYSTEHAVLGFLELTRGTIHVRRGDVARSRESFESALFLFRRIDHREGIALALNDLGLLLKNGPNWPDAREFLTRALAVSEAAGNYTRVATHSINLGILYTKLCDWELAERHLSRAITINKEVGNTFALVKCLLATGHMHRRRGQRDLAASLYGEARRICEERGYGREQVLCLEAEGDLLIDAGSLTEARTQLQQGLAMALAAAPDGDLVPEIRRRLAAIALAEDRCEEARQQAVDAFRGARRLGEAAEAGSALRVLGGALSAAGSLPAAGRVLEKSLATLARTPERFELALTQVAMAQHLARLWTEDRSSAPEGLAEHAVDLVQKAWSFFASADLPENAAEVLYEAARLRMALGRPDEALRDIARARALAERVGLGDLIRRLDSLRQLLEARSAQAAELNTPEAGIIEEWARLFSGDQTSEACLENMLRFATQRLDGSAAFVAAATADGGHMVEACVGVDRGAADAALKVVAPLLKESGICLATDLAQDPRFAPHAAGAFAGVNSVAVLSLKLPEGQGVFYLDRRGRLTSAFGAQDLRLLGMLTGLFTLGLVHARRERDLERGRAARDEESSRGPFAAYITSHAPIRLMFTQLARVGDSTASILILGETGTGKGLLAQCIHNTSSRRERPFVTINCAALPEPLLESELFGHVQGSFTGAYRTKRGLFEAAEGGTLFLDEISRASLAVQAKLLHVLDSREVRPVGSTHGKRVDVRVICASNVDLREAIRQRRFLEDLFYRLNDFSVQLPPLRERREDIPLLVDHFYEVACREMGRRPRGLSAEVRAKLLDHEWRGNIREVMQVVRRLVALSEDGEWIGAELLPAEFATVKAKASLVNATKGQILQLPRAASGTSKGLHVEVSKLEHRVIAEALAVTGWNRSRAARRLRISYPSLLAKIKRYKLRPPDRASRA